jgi:uroporphyrinogen decarboxylase
MLASLENNTFLRACGRKETEYTPIWFMRQAGRYLEAYRKVRSRHDILTICKTPELAAEVTLAPVLELGVDAAIVFADIMLPVEAVGVRLRLVEGVGPEIENPVKSVEDVERMKGFDPKEHVPYVYDTVRLVKNRLEDRVPLIGFSGAPFTLASYLIEGRPTRDFSLTKAMMYENREVWESLLGKLSDLAASYLLGQIEAGVDAVQLFDSWVGCLSPRDYEEFVLPFTKRVFDRIAGRGVPLIHFGTGTGGLLRLMRSAGGDVFGLDWRVSIDDAWRILGDVAVQGNLDPATLLGPFNLVEARTRDILERVGGRSGHIFNLGHGVLPTTPPERVRKLVQFVHESTRRS